MPILADRQTQRRLLTVADLARMPRTLPSGDVDYELHHGEIVTMAPPGDMHGLRQGAIIVALNEAKKLGLGEYRGEIAVILRRNPDHVLGPDAAFICKASLPVKRSPEGYLETIPDLVVEVKSKNDSNAEVKTKIDDYLAAGVKVVWIIDGKKDAIFSHDADGSVAVFRQGDVLTCRILPGFAVQVDEILTVN